jgi:hypothetical protein
MTILQGVFMTGETQVTGDGEIVVGEDESDLLTFRASHFYSTLAATSKEVARLFSIVRLVVATAAAAASSNASH